MATAREELFKLEWSEVRIYHAIVARSELAGALDGRDPAIVLPLGNPEDYGDAFAALVRDLGSRGFLWMVEDVRVRKVEKA